MCDACSNCEKAFSSVSPLCPSILRRRRRRRRRPVGGRNNLNGPPTDGRARKFMRGFFFCTHVDRSGTWHSWQPLNRHKVFESQLVTKKYFLIVCKKSPMSYTVFFQTLFKRGFRQQRDFASSLDAKLAMRGETKKRETKTHNFPFLVAHCKFRSSLF